ncbi:MAG: RNA methyltransferase [Melioribacteraceae bacterium]|nr:RNA methyltransferase [Melioribacteraceae bacterium]MCO6472703.1 RNA methyltransferase [Melioribacteraceae bacterium]
MKKFKTEKRIAKIEKVLRSRQHSLHVVLENIHDPHNVSAIFRSCDAVGIPKVSLIYNIEKFPKLNRTSSASARKWVSIQRYKDVKTCYEKLRADGFKIYASLLDSKAKNLYDIDFTEKSAIVLGNESRGVSELAAGLADETFYIPMYGMIQSLNVSVANAVTLYEALRQRRTAGFYDDREIDEIELKKMIDEWCRK